MVSGAPQGLVSELILSNVCVKNSRTEWTVNHFTNSIRVANMLESMAATQRKLYMLEKRAGRILM